MSGIEFRQKPSALVPPAWAADHGYYPAGYLVLHSFDWWECAQGHDSAAGKEPGTEGGAAYWTQKVDLPTPDQIASFPTGASAADQLAKRSDAAMTNARTPTIHGDDKHSSTFLASALPSGGRLSVSPAYMQTANAAAVQLDSALKQVMFSWVQEIDYAYTSLSIFVDSAPSPGDLLLQIWDFDSYGIPLNLLLNTTIASGSSSFTWIRKTFDPVQCYRGHRYEVLIGGATDVDVSLSCARWNTEMGSMFPDDCWTLTGDDGAWSDCTQDDKPALLNLVLESDLNHCPKLLYGRYSGKYVPLYDDTTQVWSLYEIPLAGLSISLATATPQMVHLAALAFGGALKAYTEDEGSRHLQDGVEMSDVGERLLGLVYPWVLRSNPLCIGPIDVMDYRGLAYAGMKKRIGKLCPYAAAESESAEREANDPDTWHGNDDFTINFVAVANTHIELSGVCMNDNGVSHLQIACGIDSTAIPQDSWGTAAPPYGAGRFALTKTLSEGFHSCYPIRWISVEGAIKAAYYRSGTDPDVRAEVVGMLTA